MSIAHRVRRAAAAVVLSSLVAGLAVVGSDGAATATVADGSSVPPAATRTVDTDRGPLEVPAEPLRVVTADYYGQFPLVDVGVVPVGISGGPGTAEPYATELADAALVGDWVEAFPEQVAAANPDLILRTIDTDDATYEQLSAIAPTAVISFQGLSLTEVVERVGELVGREDEAAALVEQFVARGAEIHERYADVIDNTTWATVSGWEGQWFLYSPAWVDNAAIAVAGIRFSEATAALEGADDYAQEQSLELLTLLADADVLLVTADPEGAGIDPTMDEIISSPLWETLPAVRAGNVFPAPQGTSSLGMALTLLDRLEEILPQVEAGS